jgi:hypothetical protein
MPAATAAKTVAATGAGASSAVPAAGAAKVSAGTGLAKTAPIAKALGAKTLGALAFVPLPVLGVLSLAGIIGVEFWMGKRDSKPKSTPKKKK